MNYYLGVLFTSERRINLEANEQNGKVWSIANFEPVCCGEDWAESDSEVHNLRLRTNDSDHK